MALKIYINFSWPFVQKRYIIYMGNDNARGTATNISKTLLDVSDVAHRLNICIRSVWRLVASGQLPRPVRIGRCARWFEQDVASFERSLLERRNSEGQGGWR